MKNAFLTLIALLQISNLFGQVQQKNVWSDEIKTLPDSLQPLPGDFVALAEKGLFVYFHVSDVTPMPDSPGCITLKYACRIINTNTVSVSLKFHALTYGMIQAAYGEFVYLTIPKTERTHGYCSDLTIPPGDLKEQSFCFQRAGELAGARKNTINFRFEHPEVTLLKSLQ